MNVFISVPEIVGVENSAAKFCNSRKIRDIGNRVVATSHHHVVKLFSWEHLKKMHIQEKQIMWGTELWPRATTK